MSSICISKIPPDILRPSYSEPFSDILKEYVLVSAGVLQSLENLKNVSFRKSRGKSEKVREY